MRAGVLMEVLSSSKSVSNRQSQLSCYDPTNGLSYSSLFDVGDLLFCSVRSLMSPSMCDFVNNRARFEVAMVLMSAHLSEGKGVTLLAIS